MEFVEMFDNKRKALNKTTESLVTFKEDINDKHIYDNPMSIEMY